MSKEKTVKIRLCRAGRIVKEGDNDCPYNLSPNVLPCSCHRPFINQDVRNYLFEGKK